MTLPSKSAESMECCGFFHEGFYVVDILSVGVVRWNVEAYFRSSYTGNEI